MRRARAAEPEEQYVTVTGSLIPRKVKVRAIGTDTADNVRIFSREELDSTGRATTGAALAARDPSIFVRGR